MRNRYGLWNPFPLPLLVRSDFRTLRTTLLRQYTSVVHDPTFTLFTPTRRTSRAATFNHFLRDLRKLNCVVGKNSISAVKLLAESDSLSHKASQFILVSPFQHHVEVKLCNIVHENHTIFWKVKMGLNEFGIEFQCETHIYAKHQLNRRSL